MCITSITYDCGATKHAFIRHCDAFQNPTLNSGGNHDDRHIRWHESRSGPCDVCVLLAFRGREQQPYGCQIGIWDPEVEEYVHDDFWGQDLNACGRHGAQSSGCCPGEREVEMRAMSENGRGLVQHVLYVDGSEDVSGAEKYYRHVTFFDNIDRETPELVATRSSTAATTPLSVIFEEVVAEDGLGAGDGTAAASKVAQSTLIEKWRGLLASESEARSEGSDDSGLGSEMDVEGAKGLAAIASDDDDDGQGEEVWYCAVEWQ